MSRPITMLVAWLQLLGVHRSDYQFLDRRLDSNIERTMLNVQVYKANDLETYANDVQTTIRQMEFTR